MFIAFFLAITVFAISFFTPESLVTTIGGFIVSTGITQWLKNQTGAVGLGALALAVAIAFVIAGVAVVLSSFLSGTGVSWDTIPQYGLQIFALATLAYKALLADK